MRPSPFSLLIAFGLLDYSRERPKPMLSMYEPAGAALGRIGVGGGGLGVQDKVDRVDRHTIFQPTI
jgi:hypothetical protein